MRRSLGRDRKRAIERYVMRLLLVLLLLLHALLGGCASQPRSIEVKVPVAVSCVKPGDVPAEPQISDDKALLKMDRRKRTLTVWDERAQLRADDAEVRALLKACSGGA